jgi:putative ABC transport system permease protein
METLLRDIRSAIRSFLKRPGFTAITVITLALAIGANTAVFSVINGLLLRPLPAERPDELFAVSRGDGTAPPASYPDYRNSKFEIREEPWKHFLETFVTESEVC